MKWVGADPMTYRIAELFSVIALDLDASICVREAIFHTARLRD